MNNSLGSECDSNEKVKRQYNHRVITVEEGTFSPLVFSVFGTLAVSTIVSNVSQITVHRNKGKKKLFMFKIHVDMGHETAHQYIGRFPNIQCPKWIFNFAPVITDHSAGKHDRGPLFFTLFSFRLIRSRLTGSI